MYGCIGCGTLFGWNRLDPSLLCFPRPNGRYQRSLRRPLEHGKQSRQRNGSVMLEKVRMTFI